MTDAERADLRRAVDRLVGRAMHWTPSRWAKPISDGSMSRAELVHGLIQRLADAAADAEGEPRRDVPRLDNDLAIPDQLRVVSVDVLTVGAARPAALALLTSAVRHIAGSLE